MMPLLRTRALLLLASIALPAQAYNAHTLSRRRIAEITAATTLAPRIARADEPPVDAEMIANIQKSRDAWKTNAARRGFAFEAGASMPFVKEGTVGAPDRSAPVHKFRDAYSTMVLCAQVCTLDVRSPAAEEQTRNPQGSDGRGGGVGPARRLGRGHRRLRARGLLRKCEDGRAPVRAAGLGPSTLAVSRHFLVTVASMASRESPAQLPDRSFYGHTGMRGASAVSTRRPHFDFSVPGPSRTSSGHLRRRFKGRPISQSWERQLRGAKAGSSIQRHKSFARSGAALVSSAQLIRRAVSRAARHVPLGAQIAARREAQPSRIAAQRASHAAPALLRARSSAQNKRAATQTARWPKPWTSSSRAAASSN